MKKHSQPRRTERGAAAVEFALVAPILIVLVMGGISLGIAVLKRLEMSSFSHVAAQTCVANKQISQACVDGLVPRILGNSWCQSNPVVTAQSIRPRAAGYRYFQVRLACNMPLILATSQRSPTVTLTASSAALIPWD